jgi:hypothetical protein
MTASLTTAQLLSVQDHAVRTHNRALLRSAYAALGYDSAVAFTPATATQITDGMTACVRSLPFTITCDDHESYPVLHWTGSEWSADGDDALRFATREDADPELRAARDSLSEHCRGLVAVEEAS